ncbi:hypothetical protein [Curvivirga aplysinae]|uniref:hypothetical protein n=1 Tax=Curvivirga aplysinae TaxID=2529852 RepID=UPI0012BC5AFD|nr:hypothetical protein [Curvivirga aplysinae]MTI11140.1 hypothetical protein [Curvivirga aplysinae]
MGGISDGTDAQSSQMDKKSGGMGGIQTLKPTNLLENNFDDDVSQDTEIDGYDESVDTFAPLDMDQKPLLNTALSVNNEENKKRSNMVELKDEAIDGDSLFKAPKAKPTLDRAEFQERPQSFKKAPIKRPVAKFAPTQLTKEVHQGQTGPMSKPTASQFPPQISEAAKQENESLKNTLVTKSSETNGLPDLFHRMMQDDPNGGEVVLNDLNKRVYRADPEIAHKLSGITGPILQKYADVLKKNADSKVRYDLEGPNISQIPYDTQKREKKPLILSYKEKGQKKLLEIPIEPGETILENSENYGKMHIALNNKEGAIKSKWFKAAAEVTSENALGYAAEDKWNYGMVNDDEEDYLQFVHHELAKMNYQTFQSLYHGQEIKGLEGLRGKELDYALVELEQRKVEELSDLYFKNNPEVDEDKIYARLSNLNNFWENYLHNSFVNQAVAEAHRSVFPQDDYDMSNLRDRIKLGKTMVDQLYKSQER